MICPSKLSPGQSGKLTDQEVAHLYLTSGTRWRNGLGRLWMVFNRTGSLYKDEQGNWKARCNTIELINLATEAHTEVPIGEAASRIRMGAVSRVEGVIKIQ